MTICEFVCRMNFFMIIWIVSSLISFFTIINDTIKHCKEITILDLIWIITISLLGPAILIILVLHYITKIKFSDMVIYRKNDNGR